MPRASVRRAARRAGRRSSWSHLRSWPWPSTLQVRGVAEAGDDLRLDRQLHRRAFERQRGHRAGDAVEFEQDTAGLDARGPEFRRTLALAHTDFGGLRRHGDVGEHADPQTALALDRTADRAAGRFDLARGDAPGLDGKSVVEGKRVSGRVDLGGGRVIKKK